MLRQLNSLAKSHLRTPRLLLRNVLWRFPKTVSELELVFVIGAPRSGTTLIQKMLDGHGSFFSIQSETGMFSKQNIFDPQRRHFGFSSAERQSLFDRSADIVDFFQNCVQALPQAGPGMVFVEKTPQHSMKLPFLMKHFPRARFIHVVRDGRDCFCSSRSHPRISQQSSVDSFARYWKNCVRRPLESRGDHRVFTLRYEDFVRFPERELGQTMAFLGAAVQSQQLDPGVYGTDYRANLGHFQLLQSEVVASSVERWKSELSAVEAGEFVRIAGAELAAFGYEI